MTRHISPKTLLPYIDAVKDTEMIAGAILAKPDKHESKTFCAAAAIYSWKELAAIISKTTGKTVVYRQIPLEEFKKSLSVLTHIFVKDLSYQEEFGYFDPDSKKLVAWAEEITSNIRTLGGKAY